MARPRRQPAQKSWKQSSRHGHSNCAWHSGHTSGWPLAASRAPRPSRGAKIAPDIFWESSGRPGVPGAGIWPRSPRQPPRPPRAPHAGPSSLPRPDPTGRPAVVERWGWDRPEQGGLAGGEQRRLARAPCLSRTPLVALEGQAAGPVNASYPTSSLPCFHLPTSPHSRPRNSSPGVLWVFFRRHPFRAGPLHCSGTVLACTLPRPAAAPPRELRPQQLRSSPRGQRRNAEAGKTRAGRGSEALTGPRPGRPSPEPGAAGARCRAGPEDPDPGLLRGAEAPWLDPLSPCGLGPGR